MGDRCVLNHSSLADKFDNNVEFHEIARVLKIPSRHYGGGKWGLSPYTLPTYSIVNIHVGALVYALCMVLLLLNSNYTSGFLCQPKYSGSDIKQDSPTSNLSSNLFPIIFAFDL